MENQKKSQTHTTTTRLTKHANTTKTTNKNKTEATPKHINTQTLATNTEVTTNKQYPPQQKNFKTQQVHTFQKVQQLQHFRGKHQKYNNYKK